MWARRSQPPGASGQARSGFFFASIVVVANLFLLFGVNDHFRFSISDAPQANPNPIASQLATQVLTNASQSDEAATTAKETTSILNPFASKLDTTVNLGAHLDFSQITHVYQLGNGHKYGRTNNNLHSVLHALDMIFDRHGDPPHNKAVLAIERWAAAVLEKFVIQTTENDNINNKTDWKRTLEQVPPHVLVHSDRLEALKLTEAHGKIIQNVTAREAYFYNTENYANLSATLQQERRKKVWGNLLQHVPSSNMVGYSMLQEYLAKHFHTNKYITIHARWIENTCRRRVGDNLPHYECLMRPAYINSLLRFAKKTDLPVVFISDYQKKGIPKRLAEDFSIGPKLIEPGKLFEVPPNTEVQNDMMIAILSDLFIGTRISTMATTIGMSRAILGADPKSNLVFIREAGLDRNTSSIGLSLSKIIDYESDSDEWVVCSSCMFVCNPDTSLLCGKQFISS